MGRLVLGQAETKLGNATAAAAAWAPVRERLARKAPPENVYRKSLSEWVPVHELPVVELELLPGAILSAPTPRPRAMSARGRVNTTPRVGRDR